MPEINFDYPLAPEVQVKVEQPKKYERKDENIQKQSEYKEPQIQKKSEY